MKIHIMNDEDGQVTQLATMLNDSLHEKLDAIKVYNVAVSLLMMAAVGAPPELQKEVIQHMKANMKSLRAFWKKIKEEEEVTH